MFAYGDFINQALTLIIIGTAVFFFLVVKPVNLMVDRFHLSPRSQSPATKTCPACFTDIPLKATRCPNCTSELAPPARGPRGRPGLTAGWRTYRSFPSGAGNRAPGCVHLVIVTFLQGSRPA